MLRGCGHGVGVRAAGPATGAGVMRGPGRAIMVVVRVSVCVLLSTACGGGGRGPKDPAMMHASQAAALYAEGP